MPQGLDTLLGPGGQGLSAGEAQLLAFARVFLKDPGLVILDEAASRLDPITEQRLERAIDALLRGRTGLVIAHRLRTVGRADDILILEGGRVAEFGPRAGARRRRRFAVRAVVARRARGGAGMTTPIAPPRGAPAHDALELAADPLQPRPVRRARRLPDLLPRRPRAARA